MRVRDLLEEGAELDAANEAGNTALQLAAFRGHLPLVGALLKEGADVSRKDKGGFAALDWAAANGNTNPPTSRNGLSAPRKWQGYK